MVKVQLLKAVKLLPRQGAVCDVWMDRPEGKEPLLLEPDSELEDAGIWTQEGVIDAGEQLRVVLSNPTGFTQYLEADTVVGIAGPVTFPSMEAPKEDEASVDRLTIEPKSAEWRKARVKEMFEDKIDVPNEQKKDFSWRATKCLLWRKESWGQLTCYSSRLTLVMQHPLS